MLDAIKNKKINIERKKDMIAMAQLVISGDKYTIYYNTDYPNEQLILHELSHIWYKITFPDISLNNNLNAEIIALLSEYMYALNHPIDGIYYIDNFYISDIGRIIRPFWASPSLETYQRLEDLFFQRRPQYSGFTPNTGTIVDQANHFKNSIYNRK